MTRRKLIGYLVALAAFLLFAFAAWKAPAQTNINSIIRHGRQIIVGTRVPYIASINNWLEFYTIDPTYGYAAATSTIARVQAWGAGQLLANESLNECCATQNVYNWSVLDAQIASNLAWFAPDLAVAVRVNFDLGWLYTTPNRTTILTNTSASTDYSQRPLWFYNLAPFIENDADGNAQGSQIWDAQVSAVATVLSNLILHEAATFPGKKFYLSWGWEPDLGTNFAIPYNLVASSIVTVARANNIKLTMGEWGQCIYGVTTQWLGWANGSNFYDAIAFHEAEWAQYPPTGPNAGPNEYGTRADQLYDMTAAAAGGKDLLMDEAEIFTYCSAATDATNADSYVEALLMLRKDNWAGIFPVFWYGNTPCPDPGGEGGYTNGQLSIVGQALYNVSALLGNSMCSSSQVAYPLYYYEFGSHAFAFMASGASATNITFPNAVSLPTYVRNGALAATNILTCDPVTFTIIPQLMLTWSQTVNSSNAPTDFIIARATNSNSLPSTIIADISNPAITNYVDPSPVIGVTNYYQVAAYNSAGTSSWSNVAAGIPH